MTPTSTENMKENLAEAGSHLKAAAGAAGEAIKGAGSAAGGVGPRTLGRREHRRDTHPTCRVDRGRSVHACRRGGSRGHADGAARRRRRGTAPSKCAG